MPSQKIANVHLTPTTGVVLIGWEKAKKNPAHGEQTVLDLDEGKQVALDYPDFLLKADNTLKTLPRVFWFSELRRAVPVNPPNPKADWGTYARHMRTLGYRRTDKRRRSPIKTLNGHEEALWETGDAHISQSVFTGDTDANFLEKDRH